jgi:peptidoglycan/LPS O-acetylase OafA/YrhL
MITSNTKRKHFRKDINGLRAIAVIAVVLFHFKPSWVPGGFVGVDVFFVISGFLMTGIIIKGIEKKNLSILEFYVARANRIIPALAMLCFLLVIFGWFYLLPLDYRALGKHVAGSIGFISNILYFRESGYFAAASLDKWLLHTWSLSVEWQFYIIYPLLLVLIKKLISEKAIKPIILIGSFFSFSLCVFVTYRSPDAAYYLLPTRAWEMMIGGIAYLYPITWNSKNNKVMELIGFTLIILSCFLVSPETPWPGYIAVFPVLGTFMVIQAQMNNRGVTDSFIFQKIGTWSYSIYLWHWPLVVGISYFSLSEEWIYIGIIFSLIFGFLSYKYIEKIRFSSSLSTIKDVLKVKPIYIVFTIGVLGSFLFLTNGADWHYDNRVVIANMESENKNPYRCMAENKFPCYIGNSENIKAIMVGDSHAESLTTSLASVFDLDVDGIIALNKASCPLILNMMSTKTGSECLDENSKRIKYLEENYPEVPLFWVARTAAYIYGQSNPDRINDVRDKQPSIYFTKHYSHSSPELLDELEKNINDTISLLVSNRPVYMILPTPEMRRNIPKSISRSLLLSDELPNFSLDKSLYLERNSPIIFILKVVAKNNNAEVLDPTAYLCEKNKCISQVEGRPIYLDGDHLSEYGNKILTPMFKSVF